MLTSATFSFLSALDKNNNKPWFDANRHVYEAAKKEVIALAGAVIKGIGGFDADVALTNIEPKSTISRINRDIRFSNNKSPYKNNFFILVNAGGRKSNKSSYYLEVRPNGCYIGSGVYMPMPEDLAKFRQEIDYNFETWKKILADKNFMSAYPNGIEAPERLSRPPKGFDADSQAIEYVKMKGFYCWKPVADQDYTTEQGLKKVIESFEASYPLAKFLNGALAE